MDFRLRFAYPICLWIFTSGSQPPDLNSRKSSCQSLFATPKPLLCSCCRHHHHREKPPQYCTWRCQELGRNRKLFSKVSIVLIIALPFHFPHFLCPSPSFRAGNCAQRGVAVQQPTILHRRAATVGNVSCHFVVKAMMRKLGRISEQCRNVFINYRLPHSSTWFGGRWYCWSCRQDRHSLEPYYFHDQRSWVNEVRFSRHRGWSEGIGRKCVDLIVQGYLLSCWYVCLNNVCTHPLNYDITSSSIATPGHPERTTYRADD